MAARAVELTPRETALLVTRRIGWEHVASRHTVYLAQKGKLRTIWNDEHETTTALTIGVLPSSSSSHQDLAIMDVDRPSGDLVESVSARRLHWDAPAGRMVASPLPDAESPLFIFYVGPFTSAEAARRERMRRYPTCPLPYPLFRADLFPGLGLRGFLLGQVLVSRARAEALIEEARPCAGPPRPSIIEYLPRAERLRRTEGSDARAHR